MTWTVLFHDDFEAEVLALDREVRIALLASSKVLSLYGPTLGRPLVDTLYGSRFPNMKELRFEAAGGVWRVAFAFDPSRSAILLVAGNKRGQPQDRFYAGLIRRADDRFSRYLTDRNT
ncbi:type II toxin-antitoxin system RelE/ParE family toxin [Rhodocista pekingensis]|uniref:Type II toxin-antitoxin system RelE/ParE family toxin n=1 Tax=Rhodocista pekingensis TaxID=201185 RepID=A0ABW2KUI6_9PROT